LSVECNEPCELAVDGKIVPGAPALSRTVYLTQGNHAVRAGFSESRSDSRDVTAGAFGQGRLAFSAEALPSEAEPEPVVPPEAVDPPPQPVAPQQRKGWSPTVFWVSAGITGVVGGITLWSGLDTLSNPGKDRIKSECASGDTSCPTYQEGLSNQRRTNVLIGVTAGAGLATVLIGSLLTDWGGAANVEEDSQAAPAAWKPRAKQTRASIVPFLSLGEGTFIGAQGRF
jgi:hypothetical protein